MTPGRSGGLPPVLTCYLGAETYCHLVTPSFQVILEKMKDDLP